MRYSKLIMTFVFILVAHSMWSQPAFDDANEQYRKGDFAKAAEAYESILRTGNESAEVYFNLGNSYYKQNKVAPAIYNFEKALLLNPNDKDARTNLAFAQKMQIDEIKEVKKIGLRHWIVGFTSTVHYNTWAMIAVGLAAVFLLMFLGYYFTFSSLYKRIFFGGMFVVFALLLLSVFAAVFERENYLKERPAIVFSPIVGVKSEPTNDADDAFVLHEGTKVYITESLDEWRKIELPDGNQGWIQNKAIKELK